MTDSSRKDAEMLSFSQSGCFSVGSCINGKESYLIPTLTSENFADLSTE